MLIRLLDTATLRMEAFTQADKLPEYAILSHTWGSDRDEVSFQEFAVVSRDPGHAARRRPGYQKILTTCSIARTYEIKYVWIDTCCIDKTSSAELSTAINSMFEWYRKAKECFVLLTDLQEGADLASKLGKCRWFTRGWCLQELVAPSSVRFYDCSWTYVGSKLRHKTLLATITKIDEEALAGSVDLQSIPIARRMSWASHRETTQIEDIAYCLLGIFDVQMPLLYGEGNKAFLRLQHEIIKHSNDLSIFFSSWAPQKARQEAFRGRSQDLRTSRTVVDNSESEAESDELERITFKIENSPYRSLFASSPQGFVHCGSVVHIDPNITQRQAFSLTNNGVHFREARLKAVKTAGTWNCYVMRLNCRKVPEGPECEMVLCKLGPALFARLRHCWLRCFRVPDITFDTLQEAYVLTNVSPTSYKDLDDAGDHFIRILFDGNDIPNALQEAVPQDQWDAANQRFLIRSKKPFEGYVIVYPAATSERQGVTSKLAAVVDYFYLACGVEAFEDRQPWVRLYSSSAWDYYRQRFGKSASLKHLAGPQPFKDDTRDTLNLTTISIKAETSRSFNTKSYHINLKFGLQNTSGKTSSIN